VTWFTGARKGWPPGSATARFGDRPGSATGLASRDDRRVSSYRFSPSFLLRSLGAVLVAVGGLLLALVVATALVPASAVRDVLVVVTVVVAAGTAGGLGLLAVVRPVVVAFDDVGYRVRLVRGAGVRQARWTQVEDAAAEMIAGERCVVVRLRDGRTTTVPVGILTGRPDDFVRDLQRHLDAGHGYRRVRGRPS
jgi:hypothetical protein